MDIEGKRVLIIGASRGLGRTLAFNNAGFAGFGNPLNMNFEDIEREIDVNYFGVLRMVRAFAPGMIERGEGMIVNVARGVFDRLAKDPVGMEKMLACIRA